MRDIIERNGFMGSADLMGMLFSLYHMYQLCMRTYRSLGIFKLMTYPFLCMYFNYGLGITTFSIDEKFY